MSSPTILPVPPSGSPMEPLGAAEILPLEAGDHLDQKTFHARYEAMPPGTRAELIGGIVYMPSPTRTRHGGPQGEVVTWLFRYKAFTPGTQAFDNTTAILSSES